MTKEVAYWLQQSLARSRCNTPRLCYKLLINLPMGATWKPSPSGSSCGTSDNPEVDRAVIIQALALARDDATRLLGSSHLKF